MFGFFPIQVDETQGCLNKGYYNKGIDHIENVTQNKHYLEHRKIKTPPHKYLAAKTKSKDRQSHVIWLQLLQDPSVFIVINFCLGREKKNPMINAIL